MLLQEYWSFKNCFLALSTKSTQTEWAMYVLWPLGGTGSCTTYTVGTVSFNYNVGWVRSRVCTFSAFSFSCDLVCLKEMVRGSSISSSPHTHHTFMHHTYSNTHLILPHTSHTHAHMYTYTCTHTLHTPHPHPHHTHTHTQWLKCGGIHCLCTLNRRVWISCTVSKTFLGPLHPHCINWVRKYMHV